jgi:hypothetical protein
MIAIHVYSDLRRYGTEEAPNRPSVLHLPSDKVTTLGELLTHTGITPEEISQIFLNYKLLRTSCTMAPWLGYQVARERLPHTGNYLETPVHDGDRIGLFPLKMALLVV